MKANEMTDEQLNRAIAKQLGWVNHDWSSKFTLPDYCNDWKYAGELLEEMSGCDIRPFLFYCENFKWTCNISVIESQVRCFEAKVSVRNCESPTRAISEAYATMVGVAE
jgi:hypothetical protein